MFDTYGDGYWGEEEGADEGYGYQEGYEEGYEEGYGKAPVDRCHFYLCFLSLLFLLTLVLVVVALVVVLLQFFFLLSFVIHLFQAYEEAYEEGGYEEGGYEEAAHVDEEELGSLLGALKGLGDVLEDEGECAFGVACVLIIHHLFPPSSDTNQYSTVVALYDYQPEEDGGLSFKAGEEMTVGEQSEVSC